MARLDERPGWIEAYLARLGGGAGAGAGGDVGVGGGERPAATAEALTALQLAHLLHVPFENLSIHRGERIVLEPVWLHDKLVVRRRGGFCYELNGLFAELLAAVGFRVELLAARVFGDDGALGIPFDHLCLRVDGTWLVDVGFGDSFVRPLRLDQRGAQHDGRRAFRIVDDGADAAILEDAGRPAFRFEHAPRALAEFEPGCAYHQTSPASPFTRRRVVSRLTSTGRITLRDQRLITTDLAGAREESAVPDDATWCQLASEHFGFPPAELA